MIQHILSQDIRTGDKLVEGQRRSEVLKVYPLTEDGETKIIVKVPGAHIPFKVDEWVDVERKGAQ